MLQNAVGTAWEYLCAHRLDEALQFQALEGCTALYAPEVLGP